MNKMSCNARNVTVGSDGFRYAILKFDVMTHYGKKHYNTVTVKLRITPELVNGNVVWAYDAKEAEDAVFKIVPSKRNRPDVRLIQCM